MPLYSYLHMTLAKWAVVIFFDVPVFCQETLHGLPSWMPSHKYELPLAWINIKKVANGKQ